MAMWRASACSVTVDKDIWVIGGQNDICENGMKTCEIFMTETMTWTTAPALNEERYGARAVVAKDKIYVVGGNDNRTVECIPKNGENTRWTIMKPRMNVARIRARN